MIGQFTVLRRRPKRSRGAQKARLLSDLALQMEALGNYRGAESLYRRALELTPEDSPARAQARQGLERARRLARGDQR
jgi:hypothetical protein